MNAYREDYPLAPNNGGIASGRLPIIGVGGKTQ